MTTGGPLSHSICLVSFWLIVIVLSWSPSNDLVNFLNAFIATTINSKITKSSQKNVLVLQVSIGIASSNHYLNLTNIEIHCITSLSSHAQLGCNFVSILEHWLFQWSMYQNICMYITSKISQVLAINMGSF